MKSLSLSQARKLLLISQGLAGSKSQSAESKTGPKSYAKTLAVCESLGYVQIDTISVVQRAHHHTLWSRNPNYQVDHIEQLISDKKVFEYWSHAAAYLPMKHYRFSLPRKGALKSGQQKHWFRQDQKLMANILSRIDHEGPLMAKDFVSKGQKNNGWGSSPTKQALESLFMQGDLMISGRKNFHKIYDLTHRVLPNDLDSAMPNQQEHGQFLVMNFLSAQGFGTISEITYLLKNIKIQVSEAINALLESEEIEQITINGIDYFSRCDALALLNKRFNGKQLNILSPFDNLLIQRKRASAIFGFDYLLECYVPAQKRQYGYFCLPILWDGKLVARADCKADKKASSLNVIHLFIEPTLKNKAAFMTAFEQTLSAFSQFNGCDSYTIFNVSHRIA
ncbi:MAG: crosslink repair DNA glycosylase YcaQ family protein [Psychromonas sp.]